MAVRTYNHSVLVGNWYEDVCMESDVLKDFLLKRDNGDLVIQKTNLQRDSLNSEVALSISRDGYLHFGDVVNLRNVGSLSGSKEKQRPAVLLSVNISSKQLVGKESMTGCKLLATGCKNLSTNSRNAFIITSVDGSKGGDLLKFGQPFALASVLGNLYLHSDAKSFTQSAKKSYENEVCFLPGQERIGQQHLAEWMVSYIDSSMRMEMQYSPVKILVGDIPSSVGINMFILYYLRTDFIGLKTAFGVEYEVSGNTRYDSHHLECTTNHFMMMLNVPGDDEMPVPPV